MPPGLPEQALELMRRQQDQADTILRLARQCPMGRILAEVAAHRNEPDAWRLDAIEDVGKDVAWRLNRYLPALGTIAVVAPLLGLFGTVVGMIEIFASFTPEGGDPSQLAHGISVAVYNAAFGIILAIPALVVHPLIRPPV